MKNVSIIRHQAYSENDGLRDIIYDFCLITDLIKLIDLVSMVPISRDVTGDIV